MPSLSFFFFFFFFFNDTATTEIYTLSLHDALPICRFGVAPKNVRDSPSAEGFTASVHKELRRSDRSANGQPGAECHSRCLPKRQRAFATALATHADARRLGCDIIGAQPCQLRDSEPSAHGKMQHGPVSNPLPRRWIRSVEQGLHFIPD